jgi:TnpA family transposase
MSTDRRDASDAVLEAAVQARVPFPLEVSDEDLVRHFSLSEADRDPVARCRGEQNRIGFSLQLCHVRWRGRLATSFETTPISAVQHIARQLGLLFPPAFHYPDRERTRREHNEAIRKYLELRPMKSADLERLRQELLARASQGLRETEMVPTAERLLRSWKILLPGPSVVREVARNVLANVEDVVVEALAGRLDPELTKRIEDLLKVPAGRRTSKLEDLKRPPRRASPKELLRLCDRLETLRDMGVERIDLTGFQPDRIVDFADRVRHYDVTKMARFRSAKKRAYLACFLVQSRTESIDAAVKTFSRMMLQMESRVRRKLLEQSGEFRESARQELEEWAKVGGLLVLPENAGRTVSASILSEVPASEIEASIHRAQELALSQQETVIQKLATKFAYMRHFTPSLLEALEFTPGPGGEDLVRALSTIRQANRERRKKLPDDLPLSFVPGAWRTVVVGEEGRIHRGAYEVCAFLSLKEAIDRGEMFIKDSRKYVSPASLMYSDDAWEKRRLEAYKRLGLPLSFDEFLAGLRIQLERAARKTDAGWPQNSYARIENGCLKLSRDPAEVEDPEVQKLRDLIEARMPATRIERLLWEVSRATGFPEIFQPPPGYEGRLSSEKLTRALLAGILALGTNLGLWTMGQMARGISYAHLSHVADWYLSAILVSAASDHVVNAHHALALSKVWGEGKRSSHDGIRFLTDRPTLLGEPNPKYFGWGDGLTSYKSMCDQWSIFFTQLISCHENEALRMLDALLSNKTALPLGEGTATDDAAATDQNFALCHLAGFPFWPRVAELDKVRLRKLDPGLKLAHLEPLFEGAVDLDLLRAEYDNMVRLVASLVDGLAPAHILGRCLSASSRHNPLARAVTALGQVYKTIYLLQYLDSPELRRTVRRLLARHESQNGLGRALAIGARGEFRAVDYEAAAARVMCHTLLQNAILYSNTCRIADIVQEQRQEGHEVKDEHLAEVSPLLFKHINFRGTYEFDPEALLAETSDEDK